MLNYISIDFNEVIELVEDKYDNNIMFHRYEFIFMGYKLYIDSIYYKETTDARFVYSVYDKVNKLVKSRNAAPLKLSDFKGKFHLNDLKSGFLFFFVTLRNHLSEQNKANKVHLSCFNEIMNTDVLYYDKVDIFLFDNIFIFAGASNTNQNISDVFVGDKDSYQGISLVKEEFRSSDNLIDYLLSNKDYQFENDVLIELLYLKGE